MSPHSLSSQATRTEGGSFAAFAPSTLAPEASEVPKIQTLKGRADEVDCITVRSSQGGSSVGAADGKSEDKEHTVNQASSQARQDGDQQYVFCTTENQRIVRDATVGGLSALVGAAATALAFVGGPTLVAAAGRRRRSAANSTRSLDAQGIELQSGSQSVQRRVPSDLDLPPSS